MSKKPTSWQDWVDTHIGRIEKKYNIEYHFSDSDFRDDAVVFTKIEGKEVPAVGTNHVDCNPGMFPDVEKFLERIKGENPSWI